MTTIKYAQAAQVVPAIAASLVQRNEVEPMSAAIMAEVIFNCMYQCDVNDGADFDALVEYAEFRINKLEELNKCKLDEKYSAARLVRGLIAGGYTNEDYTVTDKGRDMLFVKSATLPLTEKVTDENRRVSRVKGNVSKPSALMLSAQKILEDTAYCVDTQMLDLIKLLMVERDRKYVEINANRHVVVGCDSLRNATHLYSEYFADARGRLYHAACAGPNPQSSDLARSLYSLAEADVVDMHEQAEAFEMFKAELMDISGIKEEDLEKWCRGIADRPADFLRATLEYSTRNEMGEFVTVEPRVKCKKPFTTIKMAFNYVSFLDTGKADVRVGIGEDAKCSGTQYLAFIAGDENMARATGLAI